MNITTQKQTHRHRGKKSMLPMGREKQRGAIYGWESGRYKLSGIRYAQGCVVQSGGYSQYFVITVNVVNL